ncbi:TPA: hypothetical protein HA251_05810 [Candidatus Woesearchaeota archaeon]|nr:hypothetical protein [Candidatus Woesearchaeota archaeon]
MTTLQRAIKGTTSALERVINIAQVEIGKEWEEGELDYWFTGPKSEKYYVDLVQKNGQFGFRCAFDGSDDHKKPILSPERAAKTIIRTLGRPYDIDANGYYRGLARIVATYHANKARNEAYERMNKRIPTLRQ